MQFRLAFEGGGARIFAHIAALEAVHDCGLPISVVSGVSAGAIAAVLFSAGVRINHIQEVLRADKHKRLTTLRVAGDGYWSDLRIAWKIFRSKALLTFNRKDHKSSSRKNDPLDELLSDIIRCRHSKPTLTFSDLDPPVVITATDLLSRDDHVYGTRHTPEDDVVTAMVASANIPFVFYGRRDIGPRHQVDGGLFCNIPVDELYAYSEKFPATRLHPIIAFVFSDDLGDMQPTSFRDFLFSLTNTMLSAPTRKFERSIHQHKNDQELSRAPHVEIIKLECAGVGTFDFDIARKILLQEDDEHRGIEKAKQRIAEEARRNAAFDRKLYNTLSARLEFCDLRELEWVFTNKLLWPKFGSRFGTHEALAVRFAQMGVLRNALRHSRHIDDIVYKEGEAGIIWFERVLGKAAEEIDVNDQTE